LKGKTSNNKENDAFSTLGKKKIITKGKGISEGQEYHHIPQKSRAGYK
jgi:hypothetical protein